MPDRPPRREQVQGQTAAKHCAACGRTMEWRKAWAKNWDSVKFCSDACRARRVGAPDLQLEAAILKLLAARGAGKTICPSEAARSVAGTEERSAWEPLMEQARAAARRLVAHGKIDVVQGGHVVDASTAKGPIRLRLR